MSNPRSIGLDVVRALAIGQVLVVHFLYGPYSEFRAAPWFTGYFGLFGVELFFVLSGLLVGRIMQRTFAAPFGMRHVGNFYVRRWMRTVPAYLLFMVAEAWWWAPSLGGIPQQIAGHADYLIFAQNLAWPMGGWYAVTWSLTVEEWFYFLFPLVFLGLAAVGVRQRVMLTAMASVAICLGLRFLVYRPGIDWDNAIRKVAVLRLDAIAFGVLCALLVARYPSAGRHWRALTALGTAGVIAVVAANVFKDVVPPVYFSTLQFTVVPVVLALFLPSAEQIQWPRTAAAPLRHAVVWLSHHAYVLYLSHVLILSIMTHYKPYGSLWSALAMYVGACVLVATAARRLVEKPFMEWRPTEIAARVTVPDGQVAWAQRPSL